MRQNKSGIVLGKASLGVIEYFPWLAWGQSPVLEEYPKDLLDSFQLIYIIEPEVRNFNRFQDIIAGLAAAGKTVIIEMGLAETWPVFGTNLYWDKIFPGAALVATPGSPFAKSVSLDPDPGGQAPVMGNLDGVWLEMRAGDLRAPAVGFKYINGSRVYFVGLAMGQMLNSSHGREIRAILEQLMDLARPNKNYVPAPFPVSGANWGHDRFSFEYTLERPEPVWISITYAPRWKASVDGAPVPVYNLENLLLVNLPAGRHTVTFKYGMTWVGWTGIGLSALSALIAAVICINMKKLEARLNRTGDFFRRVVEAIAD